MKYKMKSISMLIAVVLIVSCAAMPISVNAASINTGVVQITEVSVSKESMDHSSVKSTEKIEAEDVAEDVVLSDKTGFSVVEESQEVIPEVQEEEPCTEDDSVILSNKINGTQNKIVVEKTVVTVPCTDFINLSTETISIDKNDTYLLSTTVADKYKGNGVVWTTSNKNIATVSSNGSVKGVGKGSCYITATIKGTNISVKAEVKVKDFILMEVKTTAYCGCKKCNGKWYGSPTASGTAYVAGRTIAVDKNVIKLGSTVEIDGHLFIAEDTGVKGKHIDIYFDSHSSALKYGLQKKIVKVYI